MNFVVVVVVVVGVFFFVTNFFLNHLGMGIVDFVREG